MSHCGASGPTSEFPPLFVAFLLFSFRHDKHSLRWLVVYCPNNSSRGYYYSPLHHVRDWLPLKNNTNWTFFRTSLFDSLPTIKRFWNFNTSRTSYPLELNPLGLIACCVWKFQVHESCANIKRRLAMLKMVPKPIFWLPTNSKSHQNKETLLFRQFVG
jgi:hypothetical protein